ncbi:PREDICTED: uncharacterized protein LOC101622930, partial [Condylura cristata]|uniref:uncharacterized protein LOC101622930 n=1 Tax=Condylura cristata TaxID=143302 RepID=UPI00064389A2
SESGSLRLAVKFFPPDPGQLQEEHTRWARAGTLAGRSPVVPVTSDLVTKNESQSAGEPWKAVGRRTETEVLRTLELVPLTERAHCGTGAWGDLRLLPPPHGARGPAAPGPAPDRALVAVRIGAMLAYTPLDEKSLALLLNYLHDFLKWKMEGTAVGFSSRCWSSSLLEKLSLVKCSLQRNEYLPPSARLHAGVKTRALAVWTGDGLGAASGSGGTPRRGAGGGGAEGPRSVRRPPDSRPRLVPVGSRDIARALGRPGPRAASVRPGSARWTCCWALASSRQARSQQTRASLVPTATLTYDTLRFAEFEDFPETSGPVWILGRRYSVSAERDEILSDVTSRLWFTYRKNFPAIGGTGPTSDTGWGCMLRCGQMIFAQALVCRHLGRDWRWAQRKRQPDSYLGVLSAFVDRKDSCYSIHQIAQMGVGEGKSIGQWYGPNTVAQV